MELGTERGRRLFLAAVREAGGREAARSPSCDPGERGRWAGWIQGREGAEEGRDLGLVNAQCAGFSIDLQGLI